jgi:hypothetical protein
MLVVVGSRHDPGAGAIVREWERWDAALLSCEDLSAPGWRLYSDEHEESRAVVGGKIVRERDIRGVLVRRPCVLQQELNYIAPADREFVAAEMNAFLVAWLTRLECRVLNRPRGTALCGPGWRPQQWALAAARIGMQPASIQWKTPPRSKPARGRDSVPAPLEIVVVGDRCFGNASEGEATDARRLAAAAGVGLLGVWLAPAKRGSRFIAATPLPGLSNAGVADAICEYLLSH